MEGAAAGFGQKEHSDMNENSNDLWVRVKQALRRIVVGPREVESTGPIPGRNCIAHQYAGCEEYTHCANCSPQDEILRAGTWAETNWRRVQKRRGSPDAD
jgi:hypothetical protein